MEQLFKSFLKTENVKHSEDMKVLPFQLKKIISKTFPDFNISLEMILVNSYVRSVSGAAPERSGTLPEVLPGWSVLAQAEAVKLGLSPSAL